MSNPLLQDTLLPAFSKISPEHVVPAISQLIEQNRSAVLTRLADTTEVTWENFVQPLDEADNIFSKAWSPVSHLNSVKNNPELR